MAHPTFRHKNQGRRSSTKVSSSQQSLGDEDDKAEAKVDLWESLRNRLKAGTLLTSLRGISGKGKSKYAEFGGAINAKLIILQAKSQHDAEKARLKERHEKRAMIKKRRKLEQQLMDQAFPTIMGLYFDGFFTTKFKLNKEYADIFNAMEEEISKQKEAEYLETFTEKTKRNFWPPRVIGGSMFRTRGVYLDYKEILKDPPHTPPDIIIDPRLLSDDKEIDKFQLKLDQIEEIEGLKQALDAKPVRIGPRKPKDFYFTKGKFFIRDLEKIYFKDKDTGIWKIDPNEDIYEGEIIPESYIFDEVEHVFKLRTPGDKFRTPGDKSGYNNPGPGRSKTAGFKPKKLVKIDKKPINKEGEKPEAVEDNKPEATEEKPPQNTEEKPKKKKKVNMPKNVENETPKP